MSPHASNLILLVLDDARLRNLYGRLLERRGYHVIHASREEDAFALMSSGGIDLLILDSTIPGLEPMSFIARIRKDGFREKLVFLSPYFGDTPGHYLRLIDELDVDLILQKPVSPMEFGIQIDHLLDVSKPTSLADEMTATRELDAIRHEFVVTLDVQLDNLEHLIQEIQHNPDGIDMLEQAVLQANQLRSAASHYGFFDLGQAVSTVEFGLLNILKQRKSKTSATHHWTKVESGIEHAYGICRRLQYAVRISESSVTEELTTAPTILVIDPDLGFLRRLKRDGEQHMIRVLTSSHLEEALHKVRNPVVDALFINASNLSTTHISEMIQQLRATSPSSNLPLALLYDDGESLDRVQGLYTGAALTIHKPLDSEAFQQAVSKLLALRRSEQNTVLLIDHDVDFARQLDTILRAEGMAVVPIHDSAHVLDALESVSPDVIMLNAMMPGISGFDICRMLRTLPRWQDLPILFVTNKLGDETRIAAFQSGGDDYLVKPIIKEELLARLNVRIERARLLRERADRDMLTGLLTRRAFVEQFAARLSEVSRHRLPLAFCLLDLDHFKTLNDTYGHLIGDRILSTLGRLLMSRFRIEDLRARWGGEEFAVVLGNEDAHTAYKVLQRILDEFSRIEFRSDSGQSFHVTFSAGIAQFPDDGVTPEALLVRADERLFQAKRAGRSDIIYQDDASSHLSRDN